MYCYDLLKETQDLIHQLLISKLTQLKNRPNFFIVGAPKCGTTAIYQYLNSHPNIYFPEIKEPNYFLFDMEKWRVCAEEKTYLSLFNNAQKEHKIIGDASVLSLYSTCAIDHIYKFNPESKLLVILRKPSDMVYSWHSQLVWSCEEDIEGFQDAWKLENNRKKGMNIPKYCSNKRILFYSEIANYGSQVGRLLSIFPRHQVKIILFDHLIDSTNSIDNDSVLRLPSREEQYSCPGS